MRLYIDGGHPLNGTYRVAGSANAGQTLMAAALLTDQPMTLRRMPTTVSTQAMFAAIAALGAVVTWVDDAVTIDAKQIKRKTLANSEVDTSVSTLLLVAPLLIRKSHVRLEVEFPLNRIRTHLEALRDLGIDVITSGEAVELNATTWDERTILLTQTSVTATALVMMLASRLGKRTTVLNAASEPHLQALGKMLQQMGVTIDGIGSNVVTIHGVDSLLGTTFDIPSDHIEAASVAAIAALCGGRVQVDGIRRDEMGMTTKIFQRLGIRIDADESTLFIPKHDLLSVSNREEDVDGSIETSPWPGFPSDLISVAAVVATQARGTSLIHEKLFNNRLLFIDKLKAMGAQIVLCDPHRAIIMGHTPLSGVYMDSPDVRIGLGMVAAALVAEGRSTIDNAQALEHTFDGVIERLRQIGAHIEVTD